MNSYTQNQTNNIEVDIDKRSAIAIMPELIFSPTLEQFKDCLLKLTEIENSIVKVDNGKIYVSLKIDLGKFIPDSTWKMVEDKGNYNGDIMAEANRYIGRELILAKVNQLWPTVVKTWVDGINNMGVKVE